MPVRLRLVSSLKQFCNIVLLSLFILALTASAAASDPVPHINQPLVPESATPGSDAFSLTVNGAGFVRQSQVLWNGTVRTTTFINSTQLAAQVTESDLASAATASVLVINPAGSSSNVAYFEITFARTSAKFKISTFVPSEFTQRVVAADLNHDGKLDLLGVLTFANAISVRLGNGNGTFQAETLYPLAVSPADIVVRDFNNDGNADVAAVGDDVVSLLLGDGTGAFQSHIDSPVDAIPLTFGIAAGDFNLDGKLDLVIGYQDLSSNSVSVLIGNGDGTFQPPMDYAAGNEPGAVAVGDFNHDGKLDIAAANFGNFTGHTVSVLIGNGDGTFQPQTVYTTSGSPLSVIVADLNHDGNQDLAVDCACGSSFSCGNPGEISILLGNGDGTFAHHLNYAADAFPYTVSAGDFDGDGTLDLLVPDLDANEVSILPGHGDGTFAPALVLGATGSSPVGVATGDFNGDGRLDAVIGTGNGLTFLIGKP